MSIDRFVGRRDSIQTDAFETSVDRLPLSEIPDFIPMAKVVFMGLSNWLVCPRQVTDHTSEIL